MFHKISEFLHSLNRLPSHCKISINLDDLVVKYSILPRLYYITNKLIHVFWVFPEHKRAAL